MQWESEAPVLMAEEEPVMMESEPMMEAEQAPSSLAAEREVPVFGEEVMVEATAEEPYGEVPEETSAVEGVVVEAETGGSDLWSFGHRIWNKGNVDSWSNFNLVFPSLAFSGNGEVVRWRTRTRSTFKTASGKRADNAPG